MTRVEIQGERGSFSHAASRQAFGEGVDVLCCRAFEELFAAVVEGGVVPVEKHPRRCRGREPGPARPQ